MQSESDQFNIETDQNATKMITASITIRLHLKNIIDTVIGNLIW